MGISFNSEQRLQREQVFAVLRRLDSGAITMSDFQDKMFAMGFDLPESIQASLRQAVVAGRVDLQKFAKQLDATVFKETALEERCYREQVGNLKKRFLQAVVRSGFGLNSLLAIGQIFRKMDTDGDGCLSFTEFKVACSSFSDFDIDGNDMRILFNSMDRNGDGVLQFEEFLAAVSGELVPRRANVVLNAFRKLDRQGIGSFLLDDAMEIFSAKSHPEVVSGECSAREVSRAFVTWFTGAQVRLLYCLTRAIIPLLYTVL